MIILAYVGFNFFKLSINKNKFHDIETHAKSFKSIIFFFLKA